MKRRTKLLFVGVGILLLLGVLGVTVMNASAEFVTPTAVNDGEYEGEWVNLEGQATDIEQTGEEIAFSVSDNNTSVDVVYEGTMPETMAENRIVVAKGAVENGTLQATELSVRAHDDEDGGPPEEHT
ncbi:cytochrome c maturation protein CcmE [Halosolutus amylolyticus]|uniref:Cytochrome c maturation protein CcmE n=1 Tax=Halosolutus amylolyticus TaxID=2932267 RepID=A0ABD5PKC3_9EURY|nr:cytochrome c maturation protein CcmE [Halosolutus amylolyticus]